MSEKTLNRREENVICAFCVARICQSRNDLFDHKVHSHRVQRVYMQNIESCTKSLCKIYTQVQTVYAIETNSSTGAESCVPQVFKQQTLKMCSTPLGFKQQTFKVCSTPIKKQLEFPPCQPSVKYNFRAYLNFSISFNMNLGEQFHSQDWQLTA